MDNLTKKQRHDNMVAIGDRDTAPELAVRKIIHGLGLRYKLHDKTLRGKPDLFLKKHKVVVNVNGCFWHHHKECKRAVLPKSNTDYWLPKIKKNIDRDKKNKKFYKKIGIKQIVIWECETKNVEKLKNIINKRVINYLNSSSYFSKM